MEVQIDMLIEKVKQHGIAEGKKQADTLVQEARSEARAVVESAQRDAQRIVAEAQAQAALLEQRGADALKQARRDLLLTVKEDLRALFESFLRQETRKAMSGESLKELLVRALSAWKFGSGESVFISLSEADAKTILAEALAGALQVAGQTAGQSAGQGAGAAFSVKGDAGISGGFRISRKSDGALQFDFTDEALSRALTSFLTPKLQEILR